MKTIQITLQERWAASQHKVHKSKKSYTRKDKHKKKGFQQGPSFLSKAFL
jgi:stalled ribosome alternative rescue factor ArfA